MVATIPLDQNQNMENSTKPQVRSTSLPSRPTPSSSQIEINLNNLKKLQPLYSSTSIDSGLACLVNMYISVDEVINSSQIQQVNLQYRNRFLIEDALVGSTKLLDSHSKLVELLDVMKENVRILQFSLGRKGVSIGAKGEAHILDYFLFRKKVKKNIVECLRSLDKMEGGMKSSLVASEDNHLSTVIGVLGEIVIATISIFRAILICLLGKTKVDKEFSLVAKIMPMGRSSCGKSEEIINDVSVIDITILSLKKNIKKNESKSGSVQMVSERLQILDGQIEGYEAGIDSLLRKLIQTRVSLLNILAN